MDTYNLQIVDLAGRLHVTNFKCTHWPDPPAALIFWVKMAVDTPHTFRPMEELIVCGSMCATTTFFWATRGAGSAQQTGIKSHPVWIRTRADTETVCSCNSKAPDTVGGAPGLHAQNGAFLRYCRKKKGIDWHVYQPMSASRCSCRPIRVHHVRACVFGLPVSRMGLSVKESWLFPSLGG